MQWLFDSSAFRKWIHFWRERYEHKNGLLENAGNAEIPSKRYISKTLRSHPKLAGNRDSSHSTQPYSESYNQNALHSALLCRCSHGYSASFHALRLCSHVRFCVRDGLCQIEVIERSHNFRRSGTYQCTASGGYEAGLSRPVLLLLGSWQYIQLTPILETETTAHWVH